MYETEQVVREWFDAFDRGDMAAARRLFGEGALVHTAGQTPIGGFDAMLDWYEKRRADEGVVFGYDLHDLLASEDHAVALLTLHTSRAERRIEWRQVAVYHVRDRAIMAMWLFEDRPPGG